MLRHERQATDSLTRRILIVGPSWVGDMVMTESLVTALRLAHPGARIDVVAPGWAAPVCERMNGIGKIHSVGFVHDRFDLVKRVALSKALRAEAYDLAIVLPSSWKSALAPFLAGIPLLLSLGFAALVIGALAKPCALATEFALDRI